MGRISIRRLTPEDVGAVLAASALFDHEPTQEWAEATLRSAGHHLLVAYAGDQPVGFVTGVQTTHPDKGTEMLIYELGVDEAFRRRGIGRALVTELHGLAAELGCYGMWVPVEPGDDAASATYRSAGAQQPEPALIQTWAIGSRSTLGA
jgi:ribosomal protein S18 acetylase RimI-like enzyme